MERTKKEINFYINRLENNIHSVRTTLCLDFIGYELENIIKCEIDSIFGSTEAFVENFNWEEDIQIDKDGILSLKKGEEKFFQTIGFKKETFFGDYFSAKLGQNLKLVKVLNHVDEEYNKIIRYFLFAENKIYPVY